jgi:hypothetical protein
MYAMPKMASSNFLTRRYPVAAQRVAIGSEVVFTAALAHSARLVASYRVTASSTVNGQTTYTLTEVDGSGRSVRGVDAASLHVVPRSAGSIPRETTLGSFVLDLVA